MLKVTFTEITSKAQTDFGRALELLNKTNQFNTTGQRWTYEQAHSALANGTCFLTWRVEDVHSQYGLVGVAVLRENSVDQFVMSCRVFGLEIEQTAMAEICRRSRDKYHRLEAVFRQTEANAVCQEFYRRSGFI